MPHLPRLRSFFLCLKIADQPLSLLLPLHPCPVPLPSALLCIAFTCCRLPGIVDKLLPKMGTFVTHTFAGVEALNDAFHLMHDPAANCIRPVLRF